MPSESYKPPKGSLPTDAASIERTQAAIEKKLLERSLFRFVWAAWHVLEPGEMRDGWHLRLICEELEKVTKGLTKNLLLNLPPRHGKSLITSVFWPVWEWITKPSEQYLCVSYDLPLAHDLARKARDLIRSEWFQSRWGGRFTLADDQDAKGHYTNDKLGARISITVRGGATGKGGGRILIDDPHNVKNVETDAERESVLYWWGNVIKSRKNTPDAACIVVMQRCHEEDLTGHILSTEAHEWRHLCLPARYEVDSPRPYDPRTEEGQALWEEMYPIPALDELQRSMDSYAVAGQYQQRPVHRKGGLFEGAIWNIIDRAPANLICGRAWDFAGTKGGGAYSAGVYGGEDEQENLYIIDIRRGQWDVFGVETEVKTTAQLDGTGVPISIPKDPNSAGKGLATLFAVRLLRGYRVFLKTPEDNKELRANPLATQAKAGRVYLVRAPWNKPFIEEARMFPRGKYKDQIDAAADLLSLLVEHGGGNGNGLSNQDLKLAGIETGERDEDDDDERDDRRNQNKWGSGYRW